MYCSGKSSVVKLFGTNRCLYYIYFLLVTLSADDMIEKNAFSACLFPLGKNFYDIFVVDLLHEFELGVWKMVFTHLMRLLAAQGFDALATLNERCVQL